MLPCDVDDVTAIVRNGENVVREENEFRAVPFICLDSLNVSDESPNGDVIWHVNRSGSAQNHK